MFTANDGIYWYAHDADPRNTRCGIVSRLDHNTGNDIGTMPKGMLVDSIEE